VIDHEAHCHRNVFMPEELDVLDHAVVIDLIVSRLKS
jgi:hypothetical protein